MVHGEGEWLRRDDLAEAHNADEIVEKVANNTAAATDVR